MHGPLRLRDYDGLIRTGYIYIYSVISGLWKRKRKVQEL